MSAEPDGKRITLEDMVSGRPCNAGPASRGGSWYAADVFAGRR